MVSPEDSPLPITPHAQDRVSRPHLLPTTASPSLFTARVALRASF